MGARRQDPTLALLPLDPEPSHGPEGRYSSAILHTREPGGEVGIALVYSKRADTGVVGVSYS